MSRRIIIDLVCLAVFALMPLLASVLEEPFLVSLFTVSYTHLTLPTICSV